MWHILYPFVDGPQTITDKDGQSVTLRGRPSPPRAPRPCWPTARSACIRTTRATSTWSASWSSCAVRPQHPHHRRRFRRPRIRHRLRQDHRRARLQRLRLRAAPRSAHDRDLHAGRPHQRERPQAIPGHGALRGPQGSGRPAGSRAVPGQGRAAQDDAAQGRPHRRGAGTHADRPVVRRHEQAGARRHVEPRQEHHPGGAGSRGRRPHPVLPRQLDHHLQPVAQQHPGLVHLAPAVVGPPDPRLVLGRRPGVRRPQRGRSHRTGPRRRRDGTADARPRRARYLVLVRPGALHHAGLAREHAGPAALPAIQRAGHGLRHHLLLSPAWSC